MGNMVDTLNCYAEKQNIARSEIKRLKKILRKKWYLHEETSRIEAQIMKLEKEIQDLEITVARIEEESQIKMF